MAYITCNSSQLNRKSVVNFKETVKKKKKKILESYQKVHITAVPAIRTNRKETNKALSNNLC